MNEEQELPDLVVVDG
ncbi:MAG: hypothetical protein R2852_05075 [Bacteroidia bacterium]